MSETGIKLKKQNEDLFELLRESMVNLTKFQNWWVVETIIRI